MKLSPTATVRAAALTGFRSMCGSYRLNAGEILRSAGLPQHAEDEPDQRLSASAVNLALERAAELSGAEDFGLQLAELRGFSNLGPVTVLARDEPDIGSALAVFIAYLPLHNEALDVVLSQEGDVAILMCHMLTAGPRTQATDVAVAMLHRVLRQLMGNSWTPLIVSLERLAPARRGHFERVFGRRVAFGQDFSGIVFDPADLKRPNLLADADLRRYTEDLRQSLRSRQDEPLSTRVQRLQRAMLPSQRCTAPAVAARLGMSRRSLDRRLALEGSSFLSLLEEVRRDVARGQVEGSHRPMVDIAGLLGFGSAAAFSAWFSSRWGMPPGRWRRQTERAASQTSSCS